MKIIVSCTTTPARLNIFYYGIQSILNQTKHPDLFLVNLSKKEFGPGGDHTIPEWLKDERITVNLTEDIGPFTKFMPALDFADMDDAIISMDDDILYNPYLIEHLLNEFNKSKDSIVCSRARLMKRNVFHSWMNYENWKVTYKEMTSLSLLPLSANGQIYSKRLFNLDLLKDRAFLDVSPWNDDLWLKMASLVNDTKVTVIPALDTKNLKIIHDEGLENKNRPKLSKFSNGIITKQIKNLTARFKNYFAINNSRNDMFWDNICTYVKSKGLKIKI